MAEGGACPHQPGLINGEEGGQPSAPAAVARHHTHQMAGGNAAAAAGGRIVLTDDMLYKLSKKIAQLTKVRLSREGEVQLIRPTAMKQS